MRTLTITDYEELKGKSIKEIFSSFERLDIPPYQRDFSWEDSQLESFKDGLYDIHKDENHFFFRDVWMTG